MDYFITLIMGLVGNEKEAEWIFLGLFFISAVAFTISIAILLSSVFSPLKRKLNKISHLNVVPGKSVNEKKHFDKTLESIDKYITPTSAKERDSTKALLMHAGYEDKKALTNFYAIKILLVIFALFSVLVGTRFMPELSSQKILFYTLVAMGLATIIPNIILRKIAKKRIRRLANAFPDALDLLVVTSEAGLGFNAALNRVANEIDAISPELSQELQIVGRKVRVGVPMPSALGQFVQRTGLFELQGLVSIISQSVKLGASMGDTLREYAVEFRDRRMQRAEEEAAKIGTKMIFPLVTCIWPGFFAIAIGPAIVAVLEVFGK
ncbi:type II secretion system F family protein [Photobacterium sp.]|uniref:type II secretion system F family protein n=1 Tax=Photobacterium sp. TaxID=660 RepID=UPI00299DCA39|nr:type II secretion system F family protein [Photobacterium sp.]MDX1302225.1 type II secretion system F family protein [Photobacterium sp.]